MARISGNNAWAVFGGEIGNHVIQRIPVTERNGRKQTSVVSVAVLALPPEQVRGLLAENRLEIKFICGGGPGGQNVNKRHNTCVIRDKVTGLSVRIANERNQHQNKMIAWRIISAKVNDAANQKLGHDYSSLRKSMIDGGRGEKVRTYNVMESRVVDHRTGKKTSDVKGIMKGNLELIL